MSRFYAVCLLMIVCCASLNAAEVPLHRESVIKFATQKEAAQLLGKRDRFVSAMSSFDRHSRLRNETATEADVLELASSAALGWSPDDIKKMTKVIESTRAKLAEFKIPFPKTVLLIQSNGKEEGGAAYCRSNAVILPSDRVAKHSPEQMERLLIHELFHILSSHNPKLRTSLYKIVGFQTCNPIPLPKSLTGRKITNPDAPLFDCYIKLKTKDKQVKATPVLYSSVPKYDAKKGGSFFKYLTFKLMVVEEKDGKLNAKVDSGEPVMLSPGSLKSYFDQIGNNTNYIIHPDEILADNFTFLILKKNGLKTPRIVEELGKELARKPAK